MAHFLITVQFINNIIKLNSTIHLLKQNYVNTMLVVVNIDSIHRRFSQSPSMNIIIGYIINIVIIWNAINYHDAFVCDCLRLFAMQEIIHEVVIIFMNDYLQNEFDLNQPWEWNRNHLTHWINLSLTQSNACWWWSMKSPCMWLPTIWIWIRSNQTNYMILQWSRFLGYRSKCGILLLLVYGTSHSLSIVLNLLFEILTTMTNQMCN